MNQPDSPRTRSHLLIAEDDVAIADALKIVFEDEGYTVEIYPEGGALARLTPPFPDLILLDIWMPGIDGAGICRQLKSARETCRIPIIIVSANRDTAAIARKAGADGFIQKPFDIDDVIRIVAKQIAS